MNIRIDATACVRRCAIYTRKSSEEGLEQSFNSLHAQREACEAYVLSQAGEGWTAIKTEYDDGGFSGGSMDRPGLKALLTDIERGLVDVVVVYKVDRLTRSLTDFAKIIEIFDKAGVSFVSVTQAFNTTTSMGRLTLNVLLSFAQFEREVTGERIRDKIALSKAKGMWMGGTPSLGYDSKDRLLIVNKAEAETVRHIFRRYLELGSVHQLRDELERTGVRSKRWTTREGKEMGGAVIGRGGLFHILQNRLYRGEIRHKDNHYPGQHPAIIDEELFNAAQAKLAANRVERARRPTRAASAVLQGLIFDADGRPMSPSFAYGQQRRLYRYYIAMDLQLGRSGESHPEALRRVPADQLEALLVRELRRLADRPGLKAADLPSGLQRVEVRVNDTQLVLKPEWLFQGDHPELGFEAFKARLKPGERAVRDPGDPGPVRISLPLRMQLRGGRTWLSNASSPAPLEGGANLGLVEALRSVHLELAGLNASPLTPLPALKLAQAPEGAHRRQLTRLAFLAPDLQQMILEGRQPRGLTLRKLLKAELPLSWDDQRAWITALAS